MKRLNKKDFIYLAISIISFILLVLLVTDNTFLYASSTNQEYINYANYLRNLFYDTKDIFPDFALSINNGINIYNLVEYGFLSPIILISYLLPFISMSNYIIISTILLTIISTILLYKFLYNHKYSSEVCFISSYLFILSTSITYNTHNNLVLINYMPFLILSLMGVDKIFKENKSYLLIISLFLSIMTNLKYSILSIIVIIIYSIYKYLQRMNKPTLKTIISRTISIVGPILLSLLCSSIILIPTIFLNIDKISTQEVIVNLNELLLPNINTNNILYSSLGIGLTSIVLLSIINIFNNKKSNIFLGTTLSMLIIFNIFKYSIGNVLTIFLPLYILVISEFLKNLFNQKLNPKQIVIPIIIITILIFIYNYRTNRFTLDILILFIAILLYYLTNKKVLFIVPVISFVFLNTYTINIDNNLPLMSNYYQEQEIISELIYKVNYYDQNFYRISKRDNNLLNSLLENNKYIISKNTPLIGYQNTIEQDGIYVYKNDNTLPIGFSTSNIMSYEDYELLDKQTKQEALFNVIVVDTPSNNNFISTLEKTNIKIEDIFKHSNIKINKSNIVNITTKETLKLTYKLPKNYHDKILFISFNVNNNKETKSIKINNITKELNISNTYQPQETIEYVLSNQKQEELNISFEPGTYNISNIEIYSLDTANIDKSIKSFDKFIINPIIKKGEILSGKINVIKDGYFMFTIPYDKGFKVKLNDQEIEYERVDEKYIGFPITSGTHKVSLSFNAPGKTFGIILSIIGFISTGIVIYLERQRKF